jgi:hypothetical protein
MTGDRATGSILASSIAGSVEVPKGAHLIPVVAGQLRPDLLLKTTDKMPITPGGVAVPITSVLGGAAHNLPGATVVRWDPVLDGVEPTATIVTCSGATTPTYFGAIKSASIFETFGGPAPTLEAFRTRVREFPAVIISWDGSEPADGQAVSQLERGSSRAGRSAQLYSEQFVITIISSRQDSDHARRHEGLEVLDELCAWMFDKQAIDGHVFSAPGGLQILSRNRVPVGDPQLWQDFYVYRAVVAVTVAMHKRDVRVYNEWMRTRTTWAVGDAAHEQDKTIVDVEFPMPQTPLDLSASSVFEADLTID